MKIYLGSDHAGYELKEKIKTWLSEWNYEFEDMGAHSLDPSDDYPDFIKPVAEKISEDPDENKGIILGFSAQGEAIAANRYKGIRAVICYDEYSARMAREHNNSNILCLRERKFNKNKILKIVDIWLNTPFSRAKRYVRRLKKLEKI